MPPEPAIEALTTPPIIDLLHAQIPVAGTVKFSGQEETTNKTSAPRPSTEDRATLTSSRIQSARSISTTSVPSPHQRRHLSLRKNRLHPLKESEIEIDMPWKHLHYVLKRVKDMLATTTVPHGMSPLSGRTVLGHWIGQGCFLLCIHRCVEERFVEVINLRRGAEPCL